MLDKLPRPDLGATPIIPTPKARGPYDQTFAQAALARVLSLVLGSLKWLTHMSPSNWEPYISSLLDL